MLAVEPAQQGERRVEVVWDAEPQLAVGWHVPSVLDPDAPALAMLSAVLTGGRTSRLYRRLVQNDRLATGVFSSIGPGDRYPRFFEIDAVPRAPHTTAELERAIYDEVGKIAETGPSDAELVRVRNQVEAGSLRRLQSNLGLAVQLANSETLWSDWRETFRWSRRLRDVTSEDVRAVARRYFHQGNRTVATLVRAEKGP